MALWGPEGKENAMGFLDELGKTFTDTGKGIAQTTRNYADVTKLNGQIAAEEKNLNAVYARLGRAWFEAHGEEEAPEFDADAAEVKASLEKIAGWRAQINAIRGVQICPECGKELPEAALFCSACGTKLEKKAAPAPDPADPTVCQSCGAKLAENARFCTNCGAPVPEPPAEPEKPCCCEGEEPCGCEEGAPCGCETMAEEAEACVEAAGENAAEAVTEAAEAVAETAAEAADCACGCAEKAAEAVTEAAEESAE